MAFQVGDKAILKKANRKADFTIRHHHEEVLTVRNHYYGVYLLIANTGNDNYFMSKGYLEEFYELYDTETNLTDFVWE